MRRKDIKGYEGLYYVTDTGEVWSYDRKIILNLNNKPCIKKGKKLAGGYRLGYVVVCLCNDGTRKMHTIHRLVAEAFLEKTDDLKTDVNHLDLKKDNNHYTNLEWCTKSENSKHAFNMGVIAGEIGAKGISHSKAKLNEKDIIEIKRLIEKGLTCYRIGKIFSVDASSIRAIKTNKTWTHVL